MARTKAAGQPLERVIGGGGIDVYNDAYVRNGRGQRGRAAAENALRRLFPGIGQQTIDALTNRADAARDTAGRQRRGGPNYVTPAQSHIEINCQRRTAEGQPRQREYQYTVATTVSFSGASGGVYSHTFTYSFSFAQPASLATIISAAERSAGAEARLRLMSPGNRGRGVTSFSIDKTQITGSFTCLV